MEKNEEPSKPPPARGDNSELEKFKRRLIRAVARMLLNEKRNEHEVWSGLKKETGCDCKELWSRMHALTVKKLNRLLEVDDRVDLLPAAARMSITDWLLFDTVLVHEDFDVIGMTETTTVDRKTLVDLFELVEKHAIEFVAGDQLADAWSALTLQYNKDNRQATPMLLQRRWYQLKLATRARFYKFWSMYKGVVKRLDTAEMYKPTPLQTDIAKRYKPLVIKPFMEWNDLIENNLVILPEDFERRGIDKEDEDSPDVMCMEPAVETINLDDDSDPELEYRKPNTDKLPPVTIKQEPANTYEMDIEENVPYENRQEKISNFAEQVMEATAMELNEIDLDDERSQTSIEDSALEKQGDGTIEINVPPMSTENCSKEKLTEQTNNEIPVVEEANKTTCNEIDTNVRPEDNTIQVIDVEKENNVPDSENTEIQQMDISENNTEISKEPETVLPQITSVFGGVDVTNETLSKIGMLTAQITNNKSLVVEKETKKQDHSESNEAPIELSSDTEDENPEAVKEVNSSPADVKPEVDVKPDISKNWFGELSIDLDFADDGIQLVDDGIAEDDCVYQVGEIKTEHDIQVSDEEMNDENEEMPAVDKKLLMVPQVRTVKLDDMGILPINLLDHVNNKAIIDLISFKSKPIIKEDVSESSEDEEDNIKRVKLSSNMLQKPKSRSYNPIQLCKNPDFNTRLKRLSIGFFSSSRNCSLLKACKPLTIDISKAFESRLMNGTMYLQPTNDDDLIKKIDLTETNQSVSVLPSAMAVQSLIDNNDTGIPPVSSYSSVLPTPIDPSCHLSERSKTINLPDISEIRRINQKLLTAQVTPLQFKKGEIEVPVSLVPSMKTESETTKTTETSVKRKAGPASRTKFLLKRLEHLEQQPPLPKVVDITKEQTNDMTATQPTAASATKTKDTKSKVIPWKPKELKPRVPWISSSSSIYSPDTLLALDTLNKMLFILSDEEKNQTPPTATGKGKKSKVGKNGPKGAPVKPAVPPTKADNPDKSLAKPTSTPPADDDNDDVQVVSENIPEDAENKTHRENRRVTKRKKPDYCCWAREKICQLIFLKKRISKHNCPYPLCLCCCKHALKEYTKRQAERERPSKKKPLPIDTQLTLDTNVSENKAVEQNKETTLQIDAPDAAVIIPIVQKPAEETPPSTENNKQDESSAGVMTDKDVACSDDAIAGYIIVETTESTETNTANSSAACISKSTPTDDDVYSDEFTNDADAAVEPLNDTTADDVSFVSSEKIVSREAEITKNVVQVPTTTTVLTDMRPPPPPPRKPRFRVRSAIGTSGLSTQIKGKRIEEPVKVTAGEPQSLHKIAPKNPPQLQNIVKSTPTYGPKPHLPPRPSLNKKMIYLNSKNISEKPTDNPIFLGNAKILLTTAKFPPNFKTFEAFQRSIKNTMALPRGIQLILQPNGRLTYFRDPEEMVSDEYMASLPHIIESIQQQIDRTTAIALESLANTVVQNSPVVTATSQSEIINLTDDEILDVTKNSEEITNVGEVDDSVKTINTNNITSQSSETSTSELQMKTADNENTDKAVNKSIQISENETQAEQNIKINETVTSESTSSIEQSIQISDKLNVDEDNPISEKESQIVAKVQTNENTKQVEEEQQISENETEQAIKISENDMARDGDSSKLNKNTTVEHPPETKQQDDITTQSPTIDLSVISEVDENKPAESNSGKSKNILSDLMAMSGIDDVDITPTPQESLSTEMAPVTLPVKTNLHGGLATVQHTTGSIPEMSVMFSQLPQTENQTGAMTNVPNSDTITSQPCNNMLLQALTAITSLAELKYACSQKGMFFKLDLETGLLVPINVCMKKFETPASKYRSPLLSHKVPIAGAPPVPTITIQPRVPTSSKSVIDLTDDDGPEISDTTHLNISNIVSLAAQTDTNKLNISNIVSLAAQPDLSNTLMVEPKIVSSVSLIDEPEKLNPVSFINQQRTIKKVSLLKEINKDSQTAEPQVKPLKLFKCKRPNVLEQRLKEIQKRISVAMEARDKCRRELKRKQEYRCASDKKSESEISKTVDIDSDCSSDEEPLSKVAIKMRKTDNEAASNSKTLDTNVDGNDELPMEEGTATVANDASAVLDIIQDVDVDDEAMAFDDADIPLDDDIVLPLDDDIVPIECLEEQSLDDGDENEDCILGV